MGLIIFPKCGEKISEKANTCSHCKSDVSKLDIIVCEDCNKEYDISMEACPHCGCPNSFVKRKKKNNKYIIVSVLTCVLIVVIALGNGVMKKAKELEYYADMETISYTMLDGAAKAETVGNLIKSVWYNAIYEERDEETDQYTMENGEFVSDFNDALSNLFTDETFYDSICEIEENQSEVASLMKLLRNPPKKYEEAYSVLKTYYDNYFKMTKVVISPTGSLNTFSEDFSTYDNDTVDAYEKMKLYLE